MPLPSLGARSLGALAITETEDTLIEASAIFGEAIIAAQEKEIAEMQAWLGANKR